MLLMKSVKTISKFFLLVSFALLMSACKADDIDAAKMKSSEKAFNERQSKELVAYMSLETMFPDANARSLAKAAGEGRVNQIDDLVSRGIDVNSRGTKDATPLFWAMKSDSVNGFKKLLELGADPNVIFGDGGTVIHWAVQLENSSFLKLALEHGGNPNLVAGQRKLTPLFKAIGSRDSDIPFVNMLLKYGADPNVKESRGNTPVIMAAGLGRYDIAYVLLNNGADYTLKNNYDENLLDRIASMRSAFVSGSAQEKSMKQVIGWLSERGVKVPE